MAEKNGQIKNKKQCMAICSFVMKGCTLLLLLGGNMAEVNVKPVYRINDKEVGKKKFMKKFAKAVRVHTYRTGVDNIEAEQQRIMFEVMTSGGCEVNGKKYHMDMNGAMKNVKS